MKGRQVAAEVITLREALKKIRELRAVVSEFLDAEEATLWAHWPHPPGGEPRLCKILADSMRTERYSAGLRRIKRARRALGLPAWWDQP